MDRAERRVRVATLYRDLRSIPKVANELGCSTTTVWSDLKALGIERMSHSESLERADAETQRRVHERRSRVAALYEELGSTYKVAKELGCARSTVCNDLSALGLAPGPRARIRGRELTCPQCGEKHWRYDSQIKQSCGEFCTRECWGLYRWQHGIAISPELVSLSPYVVTPRSRQRWKGRWAGRAAGSLGGRPAEYTDEQAARCDEMLRRAASIRQTAIATGMTKRQVERRRAVSVT